MNRTRQGRLLLWGLIALSILAGLYLGVKRHQRERACRGSEIVLDYESLVDLVNSEGIEMSKALALLKEAGVGAIAFPEDNLGTLQEEGKISLYGGMEFALALRSGLISLSPTPAASGVPPSAVNPSRLYLVVGSPEIARQVFKYLRIFIGPHRVRTWPSTVEMDEPKPTAAAPAIFELTGREKILTAMGVGFSTGRISYFARAGFHIFLRPENKDNCTPEMTAQYLEQLRGFPHLTGLIFSGVRNEVLGFPDSLDLLVDEVIKRKWNVGMVEVPVIKAQQKGIQYVAQRAPWRILRVQSIVPAMQAKMTPTEAEDVYILGARERNIRLQYVRLFIQAEPEKTLLSTNLDFLSTLRRDMEKSGLKIDRASVFPDYAPSFPLVLLLSLGAGALAVLLVDLFVPLGTGPAIILLLLPLLGTAGFQLLNHLSFWKKIIALGCAGAFPVIAAASSFGDLNRLGDSKDFRTLVRGTTLVMLKMSAISLLGGVMVVGLLCDTTFLLQIDQFRGIKLLMVLPPLMILYLYLTKGSACPLPLLAVANIPVRLWHLITALFLLLAGAVLIARTGNTPEVGGPSDLEITVRNLLERYLVARPRFKEFALGHPAFFLIGALPSKGISTGLWLWIFLVGLGQADMVDTFAHLHTPLVPTLIRLGNGLVIGWLFGLFAAWILWRTIKPRREK